MPTATASPKLEIETEIETVDVLIIGAGLSGIGAAHHIQEAFPNKSYAILESRDAIGGTWDIFRYPGIRSDSDMYTLGYRFKPWTGSRSLADGPAIRSYIRETADEGNIKEKIRFNSCMVSADWSSDESCWTVEIKDTITDKIRQLKCNFLHVCSGYYRYDEGFTPEFQGIENFKGQIVHPQHWPEDLDYEGKNVVVIGSGATAVTLVPAMADKTAHITMLQRSPSYVLSIPGTDPVARLTRGLLGDRISYPLNRWKNVFIATLLFQISQRRPKFTKRLLRRGAITQLPTGYEVDKHFKPRYNPWDQRMCMVPDGDLFRSIRHGKASIVTDHIDTFNETGIQLQSGEQLDADIVITATGLNLQLFGGSELAIDGKPVVLSETLAYKGMMLSGIPNFAFTLGYTNASWTLKADLVSEYVVRVLEFMDKNGFKSCVPQNNDPNLEKVPLMDFGAGYVLRSLDELPRASTKAPWRLGMNYAHDAVTLRHGALEDDAMRFSREQARTAAAVAS